VTIRKAGTPRRQWLRLQLILAGATALATLALFGTAHPDVALAAPVSGHFGGFAAIGRTSSCCANYRLPF
jgi:hypothetical protein